MTSVYLWTAPLSPSIKRPAGGGYGTQPGQQFTRVLIPNYLDLQPPNLDSIEIVELVKSTSPDKVNPQFLA